MKLFCLLSITLLTLPINTIALPQKTTTRPPPWYPPRPNYDADKGSPEPYQNLDFGMDNKPFPLPTTTQPSTQISKPTEICPLPTYVPRPSWGGVNTTNTGPEWIADNCPTDYRRCSLSQICPAPEVCYDPDSGKVLNAITAKKADAQGVCMGHYCDSGPAARYPENGCRPTQLCVQKVLNVGVGDKAVVRGSVKGRCLSDDSMKRCSVSGTQGQKCPSGWYCIEGVATAGELGYCSLQGWEWQ